MADKRNKIYIYVISSILFILFLWCPVSFLLNKTGVIEIEDLANYRDPEKVYYYDGQEKAVKTAAYNAVPEESAVTTATEIPFASRLYMNVFNGIEQGKASIDTVYTNYLPFYAEVLEFLSANDTYFQEEFVMMLYNLENSDNSNAVDTIGKNAENESNTNGRDNSDDANEVEDITEAPTEPPVNFIASKVGDAGMFRVHNVRSTDNSIGFLDISMALHYDVAAVNMLDEQDNINRIAAANKDVNFFVYLATRMQDTAYYNDIIPKVVNPSTKDIFDDFVNGLNGVTGIAWFDIDTLEKRLERCFITDHHWNALGAYQGYSEVIEMMSETLPDIGTPLPLKGLIEFPNVEYRGSGAARTQTPIYYDNFAVMDIDLPKQHPTERVTSKLNEYKNGRYDIGRLGKNDYTSHYENFYNTPNIITYPENNTGRKLLILGDSYVYWVSWLIGAHFDQTFVHYTLHEKDLNYNKFIRDNGITDVLLLQYSSRTLSKATSANRYLEQIITD